MKNDSAPFVTLDGIVRSVRASLPATAVRISPIGPLLLATGAMSVLQFFFVQPSENLNYTTKLISSCAARGGLSIASTVLVLYPYSILFYKRAMKEMRHPTASRHLKAIIEPALRDYCTRQPYHAAAVRLGFGQEFKEINSGYTGHKWFKWLPGV